MKAKTARIATTATTAHTAHNLIKMVTAPEKSWWCCCVAISVSGVLVWYPVVWVKFFALFVAVINFAAFVYSIPKEREWKDKTN